MSTVTKWLFGIVLFLAGYAGVWADSDNASFQQGLDLVNRGDAIGAMPYFKVAAEEGVVEAQRRLGYALWRGGSDLLRAEHWLRSAADAGDEEAGSLYRSFIIEIADAELGRSESVRSWLQQRADEDQGLKYILATTYEGDDIERALRLYQELAGLENPQAIRRLIQIYARGELGVKVDLDRVEKLKQRQK